MVFLVIQRKEKMQMMCDLSCVEQKAMGMAGRKRMETIFDKKKVVKETIGYLEAVV